MLNFGHFEDLYLAAIATIKDYLQRLDTLIASSFKQPHEVIFVFPNEPLRALGPIRLGWLRACLLAQQDLLESDLFTDLLSRAIEFRATNVSHAKMPTLRPHDMASSHILSSKGLGSLGGVEGKPEFSSMMGFRQEDLREGTGHLETIRALSCGMIFALLTEKHGPVYPSPSREGTRTPEFPVPDQEIEAVHQSSSNPCSLNEGVKNLDTSTPGGVPYSDHSKGLCVHVFAGDQSQEHSHWDASSRVNELDTYGEALSSSITGPTERTYTGSHGGSEALAPTMNQTPRKSLLPKRCNELQAYPLVYMIPKEALLISSQALEQTHQPSHLPAPFHETTLGYAGMPAPRGSLHYYASTTVYDHELDYLPVIHQRLFSREELRRPFSKLCDTPPQDPVSRSILGRRFFNFSRH